MDDEKIARRDLLVRLGGLCATGLLMGGEARAGRSRRRARLRVVDEFGELKRALVHRAEVAHDTSVEEMALLIPGEEILDHPEAGHSSGEGALRQHRALEEVLDRFGVELVRPDPIPGAACQVFTRDPCFAVGETLFFGSLRDEARRAERHGLGRLRRGCRRVVELSGPGAMIEGGDVLVLEGGRKLLVGTNRHTNEAGYERLRRSVESAGVEVVRIPHRALHLDCCVAPLPDGDALYCPSRLPEGSIATLRTQFGKLEMLDRGESERHLAANLLWLDARHVVSNVATPKTNAVLAGRGYETIELEFQDVVRLWGSFHCVVCPLERG